MEQVSRAVLCEAFEKRLLEGVTLLAAAQQEEVQAQQQQLAASQVLG